MILIVSNHRDQITGVQPRRGKIADINHWIEQGNIVGHYAKVGFVPEIATPVSCNNVDLFRFLFRGKSLKEDFPPLPFSAELGRVSPAALQEKSVSSAVLPWVTSTALPLPSNSSPAFPTLKNYWFAPFNCNGENDLLANFDISVRW